MKKARLYLAFAALLVLAAACGPDLSVDCVYTARTENILSNKTGSATTKAETKNMTAVNWSAGDKIKIFKAADMQAPDTKGMDFTLTGAGGAPTGQFTATGSGVYNKAKSYAVYPADIVKGHSGTVVKVTLPAVQKHLQGSFAPESFASVATGSSKEEMAFKNLCGVLILKLSNVTGNFSIASLSITTNGEESICGDGTVDFNYKDTPQLVMAAPASDAQKTIKLVCDPPVQLTTSATSFCFAIPAGKLSKGFTLYVNDEIFGQMELEGAVDKNTINRSESRTLASTFTYAPTGINTETTLKGMAVTFDKASVVQIPLITGTDNGWKIYWGDGIGEPYSLTASHTYQNSEDKVSVFFNAENAESIAFPNLGGINTIYISNLK